MKRLPLKRSTAPAAVCAGLCLAGGLMESQAQLTPGQQNQLGQFLGGRAEVGMVLGASDAASSGSYEVDQRRGDDTEFSLMKFGGGGEIGEARPLGSGSVKWNPVVMGTIAHFSGDNRITFGTLKNNDFQESVFAVQFGGGIAFHLTDRLTVTPSIGVIYGSSESDLHVRNAAGRAVKPFVDTELQSIGSTPGIGVGYKLPVGKMTIEFSSRYTCYATSDISDDDDSNGNKANGTSHVLENRVDFDVPLPAELWNCQLHTGGYVSRTDAFGDLDDTMRDNNWYTIHPRLVLNTAGKLWKLEHVGLGASLIAADHFTGFDFGIEAKFKF